MLKENKLLGATLSIVIFCANHLPVSAQAQSYLLKNKTEIKLKLHSEVTSGVSSSNNRHANTDFTSAKLLVANDLLADDGKTVLVKRWAPVESETVVRPADGMKGGSIQIDVRSTTAVDGSKIILSGHIHEKQVSGSPLKHAAAAGVLLPLVLVTGPLAIMASDGMFTNEGRDASIAGGTILTATVKGDYSIDPASHDVSQNAPVREPFLLTKGTVVAVKVEQVSRTADPFPKSSPLYKFTVVDDLCGEDGKTVLLRRGSKSEGRNLYCIEFAAVNGSIIMNTIPSLPQKPTMEAVADGVFDTAVYRSVTIWARPRL